MCEGELDKPWPRWGYTLAKHPLADTEIVAGTAGMPETQADVPGETCSQDKDASNDQAIKNIRLPRQMMVPHNIKLPDDIEGASHQEASSQKEAAQ